MKKKMKKLLLMSALLSCLTVFSGCSAVDDTKEQDNIIESTDDTSLEVLDDISDDTATTGDNQNNDDIPTTGDNQTTDDTPTTGDDQTTGDTPTTGDDQTTGDTPTTGDDQTTDDTATTGDDQTTDDTPTTGDNQNNDDTPTTGDNQNNDDTPTTGEEENNNDEQVEQLIISFVANNCTVYLYDTQDMSGSGTEALETVARDASGNILSDGNGQVNFIIVPDEGYYVDATCITINGTYNKLKSLLDDGYENGYRITKISTDLNVTITAILAEEADDSVSSFVITSYNNDNEYTLCGTASIGTFIYTYENGLLTINSEDILALSLSGDYYGSVVINSTEDVELGLNGCTITSSELCPLYISTEGNVDISAKSGTINYIRDYRDTVASDSTTDVSASIYVTGDLKLKGKGELYVYSMNNNGIHSKDDLICQNLALTVNVTDNALKGNDSVTISSGTYTLISTLGDGIKTSNSSLNSKNVQKGTITIDGGTINIYAACDGIDAAYDVIINNDPIINIYTDKYSTYSGEVSAVTENIYYIRTTSQTYKFSIYYYNSSTGDYIWKNASTSPKYTVQSGRSTYYYYECAKPTGYDKMIVYVYNSSQSQGQNESYYKVSSSLSINDDKDTIVWSNNTFSFTNYTTQSTQPGGGMQDGNTDKASYSSKGIKSFNSIIINGGTINIKSYDDAIHANNDEALESGATPLGNVEINGGSVTVYSNDDGIHADGTLSITGGTVKVEYSYEGVEGTKIVVSGGKISVTSKDDGFNSTLSTGSYGITITGGEIYVYAGGDGLDANTTTQYGGFLINGGKTVVISTSGGNSCLDTEQGYTYQSGYVVAMCPTGMTSECEKVSGGISNYGKTTNMTLTANNYINISNMVSIKLPSSISNGYVIELGDKSATISSSSSSSYAYDENGIYWLV